MSDYLAQSLIQLPLLALQQEQQSLLSSITGQIDTARNEAKVLYTEILV